MGTSHGDSIGSAKESLRTFAWLQDAAVQLAPLLSASLLFQHWDPPQLPSQFLHWPQCWVMPSLINACQDQEENHKVYSVKTIQ